MGAGQQPDNLLCGEKERFFCVLVDITENRKVREELRLSLERHQIIMDQTTDVIFEWDIREDTLVFSSQLGKAVWI